MTGNIIALVLVTVLHTTLTALYFYRLGKRHADIFPMGELCDRAPIAEQLAAERPDVYLSLITPIRVK